jgi:hypothetical protein
MASSGDRRPMVVLRHITGLYIWIAS